jgi:hypothetical protein
MHKVTTGKSLLVKSCWFLPDIAAFHLFLLTFGLTIFQISVCFKKLRQGKVRTEYFEMKSNYSYRPALAGFLAVGALAFAGTTASATIFQYDLQGRAGAGLLPGNEIHSVLGNPAGQGGEIQSGITFDDSTNTLNIAVGWGTFFGFASQLTGNATAMHIHGNAGQNATAGVLIGLDSLAGFNPAANGGCFVGSVTLTPVQATNLANGLLYINVHTAASGGGLNPGGEIRGNLVLVPAPGALAAMGLAGLAAIRRRR